MNSRDKGARGEREFAAFLAAHGFKARRGQQFCGIEGDDVVSEALPQFHFEVKRVERLNVTEAMEQARRDARDRVPVVAHRRNACEWLITMRGDDWCQLLSESLPVAPLGEGAPGN